MAIMFRTRPTRARRCARLTSANRSRGSTARPWSLAVRLGIGAGRAGPSFRPTRSTAIDVRRLGSRRRARGATVKRQSARAIRKRIVFTSVAPNPSAGPRQPVAACGSAPQMPPRLRPRGAIGVCGAAQPSVSRGTTLYRLQRAETTRCRTFNVFVGLVTFASTRRRQTIDPTPRFAGSTTSRGSRERAPLVPLPTPDPAGCRMTLLPLAEAAAHCRVSRWRSRYRRSVLLRKKLRELWQELRELRAARKAIRAVLDG